MALYPLLKDVPLLFYYLCDLIVYEQFFRNGLLTSCLSIAGCCSNGEKIENVYTIGAKIQEVFSSASIYEFISDMRGYKNSGMNFYIKV